MNSKVKAAACVISEAIALHGDESTPVYSLMSGGNDSLAALYVAMQHPQFRGALHINTGTGVELTRDYVYQTCDKLGCKLWEYCAADNKNAKGESDPQIYAEFVRLYGFPGPFGHGMMYARLKERPLKQFIRENVKKGERYVLVSGCREEESKRRMGTTKRINRIGNAIWCNPNFDWTKQDIYDLKQQKGLPTNPVTQMLCRSGECNCGAFAKRTELDEMMCFPETRPVAEMIYELEKEVIEKYPWRWGEEPPRWYLDQKRGQSFMFEMNKYKTGPMCIGCEKNNNHGGIQ